MTDAGATGTRRQREEWAALAARFREAAANARAERERPTAPCAAWAERRQARDEWEAPETENECGASHGAETSQGHPNPTSSPEACQTQLQALPGPIPHNLSGGGEPMP